MRTLLSVLPAMLCAGAAVAQSAGRADPRDPQAKVPPVEYRSAFEGYRPFADQDLRDWRHANEEVGRQASKPAPDKPEASRGPSDKGDAPAAGGHGGHK